MSEPRVIRERVWYDGKGRRRVERTIKHEVSVRIPIPEENHGTAQSPDEG